MKVKKVYSVYFSASGRTKLIANYIAKSFSEDYREIDLLKDKEFKLVNSKNSDSLKQDFCLDENDFMIIGMPVFAGRIPKTAVKQIEKLKGSNTKAIVINTYGNRAYDDALLELNDLVTKAGFKVVAAAAFVAKHSIFPVVAQQRPDFCDYEKIEEFTKLCKEKIDSSKFEKIKILGKYPYTPYKDLPLKPTADDNCVGCGKCVEICPAGAITLKRLTETNCNLCISCTACIYICPANARAFRAEKFAEMTESFAQRCSERKEPEWFL